MSGITSIEGATIPGMLDDRAAEAGDADALLFPSERIGYRAYADRTMLAARRLRALGVDPGDKVGILQSGGIDLIASMFGAMRLGAVAVPVNARYKSTELLYLIKHADVKVLLVDDDFAPVVLEAFPDLSDAGNGPLQLAAAPELRHVVTAGKDSPGLMPRAMYDAGTEAVSQADVAELQARIAADDVALLLYTSGTTAHPKGCMHSHSTLLQQGVNLGLDRLRLTIDDVFWSPLPLFHVGGIVTVLAGLVARCAVCHVGLFEPGLALRQLADEGCTIAFPAFETMWLAVLDHPDFAGADLSAIRGVLAIGVPARLRSMQERMPHAVQVSMVGSTEAAGFLSIGVFEDSLDERSETGGHVVSGMEVKLLDPATGDELPPGNTGELLFRGSSRFLGYYRDPEITAECIDADGWFHSGDIIRQDVDGRITFLSRLKDMLKVGGENVAAAEIESHLAFHPAINVVQVVSAPDARYTEVPAAFVQLKDGATATEEELIDYCMGSIATFKVPRYVRFVDEWPMSGTKVQKYKLRERIASELDEAGTTEAPKMVSS